MDAHFAPTSTLIQEITAGAHFDVIIGIDASLTALSAARTIDARTLTPLAKTGIGIAVAPAPRFLTFPRSKHSGLVGEDPRQLDARRRPSWTPSETDVSAKEH